MNIFILDQDVTKSAQSYVNKHVVKMMLEYAQILSTVVRITGVEAGYNQTHIHHPCTKWAGNSLTNWLYLRDLAYAVNKEWQFRYGHTRNSKAVEVIQSLPVPSIADVGLTEFAQAMPDDSKVPGDAVVAYRTYYVKHKQHIAEWGKRGAPWWWLGD